MATALEKVLHDVKIVSLGPTLLCPYCGHGDGAGAHAKDCPVPVPSEVQ